MKKIVTGLALVFSVLTAQAQYENTKITVGEAAPELAYNNPEGKLLKLSEISKNRVVLIDFWASWCRPCRMANPKLVQFYHENKAKKFEGAKKGFTVLSVSLDEGKEQWKAAIAKDSLTWEYHMSDLGGWKSAAAEQYGVQYIPQAFLVLNGKVLGKYNTAEEAESELKKLEKTKKRRRAGNRYKLR